MSDIVLRQARTVLRDFAPGVAVPEDEDGLIAAVKDALEQKREHCRSLIADAYAKQPDDFPYPGRETVGEGAHLISEVLQNESDGEALLNAFKNAGDDLLDFVEDMEPIDGFFPNQQRLFDESAGLLAVMSEERVYLEANQPAQSAIADIAAILRMEKPYGRIHELSGLNQQLRSIHRDLLDARRDDLLVGMENALAEVVEYIEDSRAANPKADLGAAKTGAEESIARRKGDAHDAKTLTKLDALSAQLDAWRDNQIAAVDQACAASGQPASGDAPATEPPRPKVVTLRREEVCPVKRLSSEQDVDAYVAAIREKLLAALEANSSVRIG